MEGTGASQRQLAWFPPYLENAQVPSTVAQTDGGTPAIPSIVTWLPRGVELRLPDTI